MDWFKNRTSQIIFLSFGFTTVATSFVNCSNSQFTSQALPGPASVGTALISDSVKSTNVLEQSIKLEFKLYSEINGERVEQYYNSEPVQGIVVGADKESTYTCVSSVFDNGACDDPDRWTKLPNQEWSFDEVRRAWIMNSNLSHLLNSDEISIIRIQDRKNNSEAMAGIYLSSVH